LWSLDDALPPWDWRRRQRERSDEFDDLDDFEAPGPDADAPSFECGAKRYCGDMATCEEARYHLEHCGLARLDSDSDGVPCESLCR
jgi:hypothetical protein